MSSISDVIKSFPNDLQDPVFHFWEALKEELGVKREDFTELKKNCSGFSSGTKQDRT